MSARKRWFTIMQLSALALVPGLVAHIQAQGFKLTLAPEGNLARFTTTETFVGIATPFDPVGVTPGITGAIYFDAAGRLNPKESKITVDLTQLKTDQPNRDRQLKSQSLETVKFPNAVLAPTELRGLATPLPLNGDLSFTLVGNLTMHGVTKPTTWTVTATAKDGKYVGKAKTIVRFDLFDIKKPTFAAKVLSIVDEVRLEYEFSLVKGPADR